MSCFVEGGKTQFTKEKTVKYALIILSALLLGGNANGLSFAGDVLELQTFALAPGGPSTKISIDDLGAVTVEKCQAIWPEPCTQRKVKTLSRRAMRAIYRDINQARQEPLSFPEEEQAICLALPIEEFRYTADINRILLGMGSRPCGGDVVSRKGRASNRLQQRLDRLFYEFGEN